MKMEPVESRHISHIGHEERTGLMRVRFQNGGEYMFGNVQPEKFKAMMEADSIGQFFHREIKNNKAHSYVKMEPPPK